LEQGTQENLDLSAINFRVKEFRVALESRDGELKMKPHLRMLRVIFHVGRLPTMWKYRFHHVESTFPLESGGQAAYIEIILRQVL
jgi:hypothetical protein